VATYSSRTVGLAIESEIIRHGLAGEIERRGIPHKRLNVTEASTWVLIEPSQRVAVVDFTELVAKYNPDPNIRLIGACYAPEMDDYLRCLSAGGVGIIDVGMTFDSALRVIDGAFDNDSVLPRDVLKVIAQRAVREPFESLGQLQRQLLVGLCSGMTIGCLARSIGYSERHAHDLLANLYREIGVKNRSEAILWTARSGILTTSGPDSVSAHVTKG
jgi:DNA-binding CsgD family transcriptional regulator